MNIVYNNQTDIASSIATFCKLVNHMSHFLEKYIL